MIDICRVQQSLKEYISKYDINDDQIKLKIEHIYRVSELSRKLACSLNLSEDDIVLAQVIGLLHDIGRFEQIKRYHTFIDKDSINHGEFGCKILFDEGLIRNFVSDSRYDKIIRDAIINHNRPEISHSIKGISLFHSKIIRDADKTDILYLSTLNNHTNTVFGSNKFQNEIISEAVYNDFVNKREIDYNHIRTSADVVLCHLAYVFDYNFDDMIKFIWDEKYLDKIYKSINFCDLESDEKFTKCYRITKDYMNKRIKRGS